MRDVRPRVIPTRWVPLTLFGVALGSVLACGTDATRPAGEDRTLRLEKIAGDRQSGIVGEELSNVLEVRVVDAEGQPVSGESVSFAVYAGGGGVTTPTALSGTDGMARTRWTLGTSTLSAHQVIARLMHPVTDGLVDAATFTATAQPAAAARLAKVSGDLQSGRPSEELSRPLVVAVHDRFGNAKATEPVTWTAVGGDGIPRPGTSHADGEGHAQTRFTLGSDLGSHSLRATLASGQFVTFSFAAVLAARPAGVIERTDPLASRPYAAAISSSDVVYITQLDASRLSRINLPTLGFAGTVSVGSVPTFVSFNRSGTRAYVANQYSQSISVVDVASNREIATIPVIGNAFVVTPNADDTRLYVVTNSNRLYQLDPASGNVLASVALLATGQSMAFHPNGYLLYVSTFTGGTVLEIDTRDMTVGRTFVTGSRAQGVVVSADGSELWIADEDRRDVTVFDLNTGAKLASIPVGGSAWDLAITPDQTQLYVGLIFDGKVAIIDRATRTVVGSISTGGNPRRIVFNTLGTMAVVANESGYVTYIR